MNREELKTALREYREMPAVDELWNIKLNAKTVVMQQQYNEITAYLTFQQQATETTDDEVEATETTDNNDVIEDYDTEEVSQPGGQGVYIKPSVYWMSRLSGNVSVNRPTWVSTASSSNDYMGLAA